MIERGRMIEHGADYKTETVAPWELPFRGQGDAELYQREYPVQSRGRGFDEWTQHHFVNDLQNPYQTIAFFACAMLSIALPLLGLGPAPASDAIGIFVTACRFVGGIAYGCYLVPLGALILDIADEHEVNTGRPQQGLVSAVHFLGLQAASAIVGLLAGVFLTLIAFPVGLPPEQMPAAKVASLGLFVCGIIAVASALLVIVVRTLDTSREKQAEIAARLVTLRSGAMHTGRPAETALADQPVCPANVSAKKSAI